MENLIFSLNVVLPMFFMMCIGMFMKKVKLFDESFLRKANSVTFKSFMPVLLFYNIYKSHFADVFNIRLVIFAVVAVLMTVVLLFIGVTHFEKDNKNRGVMIQGMFRSNFVLFGIPVCINLFGEASVGVPSMLIAIIVPIFNFIAVFALAAYSNDKFSLRKTLISILKNPLIIGSLIGVAASLTGLRLPVAVEKAVADMAGIATPLALILLGGEFELKNCGKNLKRLTAVAVFKLVIIPCIVLGAAITMGFRGVELGTILAMTASPVAVSSFVMAQEAGANDELAGEIVVVTTAICSFTMFLFIFVMKTTGLI